MNHNDLAFDKGETNILAIIDKQDYDNTWEKKTRIAIRGIIEADGKVALIHSKKYGEYKFPGGGMEKAETQEETLIREVQEETGLLVIPETIRFYGMTKEMQKDKYVDVIFEQISYYYHCEVSSEMGVCNLDEYEKDYGYELIWITLDEAMRNNRKIKEVGNIPWIHRDTMVMKKIDAANTNWCQSVAGIVIVDHKVLLVRHTYGAGKGKLIIPGGYVKWKESPQDAVKRELLEETGVIVEPQNIVGIRFNPKDWYVVFKVEYIAGEARSDEDENSEAVWIDIDEAIGREDVPDLSKKLIQAVKKNNHAFVEIPYIGNAANGPYSLYSN